MSRRAIIGAVGLAVLAGCSARGAGRRSAPPPPPPPESVQVAPHPSVVAVMASGGRPGVVSSGFFVGPGVVVTTGHGIEGATRRSIRRFPEGQRTPVLDLLGESRDHDLATLDVGSDVPAAPLRLSNRSARVGESVRVVWAKNSRTQRTDRAVVSRGEAFVRPWGVVFQIRASLELGCSGAPVLDDQGNVLGVVIAGSPTGGFFFAVPPRFVRELTDGITARSPVGITSPAPAVAPREAR